MHFTTESEGLMRFPHQYPPPRPRPWRLSFACTAAFASRSRWTTESWPAWAAKWSGVLPQEPRPEANPQAEPNGTNWEKVWENFGCLKSRSFGNFGHSISSMDLTNTVVLRCLEVIELAEKATSTTVAVQMIWYHYSTINLHGPASFSEKQYISACCMLTNYHKNPKNSTFKSKHGTTKWNETTPGHWMPLHHVIASPNLQGDQATTSLRPVPSSSVFCMEFTSLRIKCLMAPTLFSLAASRMSRPRIPFKSKISCWGSDA